MIDLTAEEEQRNAYLAKCLMLRNRLIRIGLIEPDSAPTKPVACASCGESFQILTYRFDTVCGCIYRRRRDVHGLH